MLRAVGHAVVVNPDGTLRRIALQEGWEVVALDRLGRRLKMLLALGAGTALASADRKSTRLNSSHQIISYAVFCLKKKRESLYFAISQFHAFPWQSSSLDVTKM